MNSLIARLLDQSGATVADLVIVIIGFLFALYVINRERSKEKTFKDLWTKINKADDRCHRLDALQYGTAKAIQAKHPDIKLIKESADGDGDYSLDRS